MEKTLLNILRGAAVQCGCRLPWLIIPCLLYKCCWLGVGVWWLEQLLQMYRVCLHAARQCVGQLVMLQGGTLSEAQDGSSPKPPSCKIRGSWYSQCCPVVMLRKLTAGHSFWSV